MKIDLHIHSDASSDGEVSVERIIDIAVENGLEYIAIADHESIAGVEKALEYAKDRPVTVIPATEIFVSHNGRLLHMLGYAIDIRDRKLNEVIRNIWDGRREGIKKQFDLIRKKGLVIEEEDVFSYASGEIPLLSAYIHAVLKQDANRNHRLVHGMRDNIDDIITMSRESFGVGKELYAPTYMPESRDLVKTILDAGGAPVIAHPGVDIKNDIYVLDELKSCGIRGVEAYYTSHTPAQCEMYRNYALKNGLFYTCGSDFHGSFKPNNVMGGIQTDNNEQAIEAIMKYM